MNSKNYFKGEFWKFSPNWFDWFALIISILSIIGGYLIARKIYRKEKRDKEIEEKELILSEVKLFKNSLLQLRFSIAKQIESLKEYIQKQNFILEFNQGVHVDFLNFVDVKYLYKNIGVGKQVEIQKINNLLSSLYTLNDFRISLRDEFRTYMKKYHFHEDKFYTYRKLLYTKYFELCNQRALDVKFENGVKKWSLRDDDIFMQEYSKKRIEVFQDNEVMTEIGLKDKAKLNERFILPLIGISADYIPEDYNAIEVNDISNVVNSAYADMEHITQTHFQVVNSHLKTLEDVNNRVSEYLQ